ncbi:signal transduction histidine kinase [Luteibacter sp. HA06]
MRWPLHLLGIAALAFASGTESFVFASELDAVRTTQPNPAQGALVSDAGMASRGDGVAVTAEAIPAPGGQAPTSSADSDWAGKSFLTSGDTVPLSLTGGTSTSLLCSEGGFPLLNGPGIATVNRFAPAPSPVPPTPTILSETIGAGGADRHGLANGRDLNVRYAVPAFEDSSAVRFRYRLAGFETGWQDAGDRREASYTGLPDGNYRFEVESGNQAGDWSPRASFNIEVAARFFETLWFRVLAVLAVVGVLYAAWRLRLRHVTSALRIRLDERGIVARDMHDTILQAAQAMAFRLDVMANCQRKPPTREELASLADYARKTIEEGRRKLEVLRADHEDDVRPVSALVRLANELASQGGPTVTWTTEGKPRSFNPLVGAQIRSIGREMLYNAFMHAKATRIQLHADYGKRRFALTVQDDGCGVDVDEATSKRGHYGLRGMKERTLRCGGCLRIGPLNPGTLATVTIPAPRAYSRPI